MPAILYRSPITDKIQSARVDDKKLAECRERGTFRLNSLFPACPVVGYDSPQKLDNSLICEVSVEERYSHV